MSKLKGEFLSILMDWKLDNQRLICACGTLQVKAFFSG